MRVVATVFLIMALLLAAAWWFFADEALEPATKKWLETSRSGQQPDGLDYLFLMGLMAPADEDPIKFARDLARQMDEDFSMRVDYLDDLMQDSPCDIEDWACWENDHSPWVSDTLASKAHVLERWHSLPVHNDFGEKPMKWLFGLLAPAAEALDHFMTLHLIDAKRGQGLDELASQALEHSSRLAAARPNDGSTISLLVFEITRQKSLNQLTKAIRLGAAPPSHEEIDRFLTRQMSIEGQLTAWSLFEFNRLEYAYPYLRGNFPDNLLARENRTLNRARSCLEQVVALSDPDALFGFMETDSEICGPEWRSWRNWRGDDLIDMYFYSRNDLACRVHAIAHRDGLAKATLRAVLQHDSDEQRLAAISRANPFYPNRGAYMKEGEICFEPLEPDCGNVCLAAPWNPIPPAE